MGTAQFSESKPLVRGSSATAGTGTSNLNLFPFNEVPARVDAITARNSDPVDHTIVIHVDTSDANITLGEVVIPAGAGVGGVIPFDVLGALGPVLALGLFGDGLATNWTWAPLVTCTTGTVDLFTVGGWLD